MKTLTKIILFLMVLLNGCAIYIIKCDYPQRDVFYLPYDQPLIEPFPIQIDTSTFQRTTWHYLTWDGNKIK